MSPQKRKEPRELVQHDWDFSGCPPDELPFCFRYEYYRESDKVKEVVQRFRECRAMIPVGILSLMSDWLAHIPAHFPDFPKCPWLDLPKKERTAYVNRIGSFASINKPAFGLNIVTGETLDKYEKLGKFAWSSWRDYCQSQNPAAIQGWFEISPGFSKKDIRAQFERCLGRISKNNPKLFSTKSGGRGVNSPMDQLRELAAYRIMNTGRRPADAAKFVSLPKHNKNGKLCVLYGKNDHHSWVRARNVAQKQIDALDQKAADFLNLFKSFE
jgi:hypothetical protein